MGSVSTKLTLTRRERYSQWERWAFVVVQVEDQADDDGDHKCTADGLIDWNDCSIVCLFVLLIGRVEIPTVFSKTKSFDLWAFGPVGRAALFDCLTYRPDGFSPCRQSEPK